MQSELKRIKELIRDGRSVSEISVSMGYRSTSTVHFWLNKKKIPKLAMERVRAYLGEKKNGKLRF